MIYVYVTGRGCADVCQYLMLNDSNPKQILYNIEEKLRQKSTIGRGKCFIFAAYDVGRLKSVLPAIEAIRASTGVGGTISTERSHRLATTTVLATTGRTSMLSIAMKRTPSSKTT